MMPIRHQQATSDRAIILVEPQMGENIGAAARAMANFGLTDLRLVSPARRLAEPQGAGGGERRDRHHRRRAGLRLRPKQRSPT